MKILALNVVAALALFISATGCGGSTGTVTGGGGRGGGASSSGHGGGASSGGHGGGAGSGGHGGSTSTGTGGCSSAADCPAPANACVTATCNDQACGTTAAPKGTLVSKDAPADCMGTFCDGSGDAPAQGPDDDNVWTPMNACLQGTCTSGVEGTTPAPSGTVCAMGGTVCDGAGNCVACLEDADCNANQACNALHQCEAADGQACNPMNMGADCASGNCSSDAVCCQVACSGPCQSCAGGSACVQIATGAPGACPANQACNAAGACEPAGGQMCDPMAMPVDCASGFCSQDGFCCPVACNGPCDKCAGGVMCGLQAAGQPGACGANQACNAAGQCEAVNGQACVPANDGMDCVSGNCSGSDHVCCAVACGGPCQACAGGATCTQLAVGAQGACPASQACNAAGQCEAVDGQACQMGNNGADCESGHCVGGVCCNTACNGTCQACTHALTGLATGTCGDEIAGMPAPAGQCAGAPPCGNDGKCAAGGACEETLVGTQCAAPTCVGGVLTPERTCDGAGTCTAGVPAPCVNQGAASCGTNGVCNAAGNACEDYPAGTQCAAPTCAGGVLTPAGTCNGAGVCNAGVPAACVNQGAASCGTNGACNAAGNACEDYPAGTQCAAATCAGGMLEPARTCNGAGVCNAGVPAACVNQGAASCGTNGQCNAAGNACEDYPAGTQCAAATCAGGMLEPAGTCNGAGVCNAGVPSACVNQGAASCGTNGQCNAAGNACEDYPVGTQCAAATCAGGMLEPARTCNGAGVCNAGVPAACVNQGAASCGTNGQCNAAGNACEDYPAGTQCAAATCAGGMLEPAGTCNGAGVCNAGVPSACVNQGAASCGTNGQCNAAGNACEDYPAGTQCAAATCAGGMLEPARTCNGAGVCNAGVPAACVNQGAASCGTNGQCNAAGNACEDYPAGTQCAAATCAGGMLEPARTCNGAGVCNAGVPVACVNQGAVSCGTNGQCNAAGNACEDYPSGTPCGPASCAGGVLTPSKTCDGAGVCNVGGMPVACVNQGAASCGTNGQCNAAGNACEDFPAGTVCVISSCVGGVFTPLRTCDGAGACSAPMPAPCADQGAASCGLNGQCNAAGSLCELYPAGSVCAVTSCESGVITPERTCNGTGTCDPPGASTTCVDQGAASCGTNGVCNAAGNGCADYPVGTECAPSSCAAGVEQPPKTCNAAATCVAGAPVSCAPFACNGNVCAGSCVLDSDCAVGPCNDCPAVVKLCLAPLGVGDCQANPCHPPVPATCGKVGTFAVGNAPQAIAFDGTDMWIADNGSNRVVKVSLAGATIGTFAVGTNPAAIAFDGTNMWVANEAGNNVTKLSPAGATLGTFAVGTVPGAIAFDGTNMWVVNYNSKNVTKLSPAGATLGTFAVGTHPDGIAFDGTNMWVANQAGNDVTKLSPAGATLGTFAVGNAPWGIAFDGANMWIANHGDNTVTEMSLAGATIGIFAVGSAPRGIAFDGTNMWVTNFSSNSVTKLSPAGATLGTFAVGTNPVAIAFDGTHMWVANFTSNNVTEL